ncbi:MAG: CPBP family intramembrane metalloprotease [Actinobacteria bacterium]|nr:CPBP family intramembrane metalloprotease [Actinomycetota bacterium]
MQGGGRGETPSGQGGPVAAKVVASCAFHPGVRAVTRCSRCGSLICSGCQREAGGRRFCETCFRGMLERRGEAALRGAAYGRHAAAPRQLVTPWRLWPGLAFLPVPFALSGLMTYMMRQGGEVSVGLAQLFISLLLYSTTLGFAYMVVSRHGDFWQEMGVHAGNLPASLGLGVICGSLAFWIGAACAFLSNGLFNRLGWLEEWLKGFFDVNARGLTGGDLILAGVIIVVAAPLCEELFFRGYLYPAMRDRLGVWAAVFLNGFIFSAVHFSLYGLLGRTLSGALFCLLYEYTDNLWSSVTAHALNNFVAFFLPLAVMWSS